MEPNVQPIKSHSDNVISPEKSRKRKGVEAESVPELNTVIKPEPQTNILPSTPSESDRITPVMTDEPSQSGGDGRDGRIDVGMRTQVSMSRAMTVELNTLRDIMPKLKREIHTYSINECQLVKELETKIPACHEHRDVRLNLVLEEIQRLRINKRRALRRLKESQVRIVELESGMESSSYEAGELFWDSRITKLTSGDYSARLNILAAAIIEEKKANFSFTPATHPSSYAASSESNVMTTGKTQSSMMNRKSSQGYFIESTRNAAMYGIATKKSDEKFQNTVVGRSASIVTNMNNSVSRVSTNSQGEAHQNNSQSNASILNPHELGHEQVGRSMDKIDLEKMVTEARRRRDLHKNFRKRNFLIAIVPVAAVVGLLLLDWQTGFLSRALSIILGN